MDSDENEFWILSREQKPRHRVREGHTWYNDQFILPCSQPKKFDLVFLVQLVHKGPRCRQERPDHAGDILSAVYPAFFPAVRVVIRRSFPGGWQSTVWVR